MADRPSLLPKEHGAYAQMAFPLGTGLLLSAPSFSAFALALAAIALFLSNEPMAILLGVRGKRLKDQLGARAKGRATLLVGVGVGLGLVGLWRSGSTVWPEIVYPLAAAVLLIPTVLLGRQKSLIGEFVVVTTFSSLLLPLAAASGANHVQAVLAAVVWWVSFGLGTLEVHAIKARLKTASKRQWTRWGSPSVAAITVAVALWMALGQASPFLREWGRGTFPGAMGPGGTTWASDTMRLLPPSAAALLPPALATLTLSVFRIHPRHLKRVGWTLVGANALTLILLLFP